MPYLGPSEDDEARELPCGCGPEYHLADCPHLTGDYGPSTKEEWLAIMSDPDYDEDQGGY